MSGPLLIPQVNFSRDLRRLSLALALVIGALAVTALLETGSLLWKGAGYWSDRSRTLKQADELGTELKALLSQHRDEPDPVAVKALRQRITSLNALDYASSPSTVRVLATLEQIMPATVAIQNLDYDRGRGALELVAVSQSSDDLTAFFDVANQNKFFPSVRLVDKKQGGATSNSGPMYQVRLSIRFAQGEPRS